jgi:hypothetical protein
VDAAQVLKEIPWKDTKKRLRLAQVARQELDQVHGPS